MSRDRVIDRDKVTEKDEGKDMNIKDMGHMEDIEFFHAISRH